MGFCVAGYIRMEPYRIAGCSDDYCSRMGPQCSGFISVLQVGLQGADCIPEICALMGWGFWGARTADGPVVALFFSVAALGMAGSRQFLSANFLSLLGVFFGEQSGLQRWQP